MGSKHQACCSSNLGLGVENQTSCISNTPTKATESGCCESNAGAEKLEDNPNKELNAGLVNHSWIINGMDCPSCARKIETAVKKVTGVAEARVAFATEKLLIKANNENVLREVEQVITETGFSFNSQADKSLNDSKSRWHLLFDGNVNIIAICFAMMVAALTKGTFPEFSNGLFTLTCLAGLYPIVKKAFALARSGTPFAIETLMSVAAVGALYLGETAEAAMVLLLFLIGERLEAFAASRARSGVQALMELVPENAVKIVEGKRIEVAASDLQPGDIIEVSPGSRLPADGLLMETPASFDESALTGESIPVEKLVGASVMAGAVVVDRVVSLTITSKQGENTIDRILHMIEEAESRKAPLERFLDKFSRWYTPLMMIVALGVITIPPLLFAQSWDTWLYRGLALLLIACPCALVISTPAAITSGLAAAARRGALVKGGAALELLGGIETIAFDKTGTLTIGKPLVTDIITIEGMNKKELVEKVAMIELGSSHPIAISIVNHAKDMQLDISEAEDRQALVGVGVRGVIRGESYQVSAPSKITLALPKNIDNEIELLESEGKTVVVVTQGEGKYIGLIALQDQLRDDAINAIKSLRALGIRPIMLTGDNSRAASQISQKLGLDFEASLLPEDKVSHVERLAQFSRVAMVGDGINDAPAMKASSIGIAMGGGTDVALETADAAITHNRLTELSGMIELSRATLNNIRQNVFLALGLKGVFLVTSLMGITGLWVAVLADSGATAIVTLNALRLLKFKPIDKHASS